MELMVMLTPLATFATFGERSKTRRTQIIELKAVYPSIWPDGFC
jgi:hypothetical protein